MDSNITLGVSEEELAEFPNFQQPAGTVVPNCQDSLQTPSITKENTIEEETIEERGTSLTTKSSAQGSQSPISSGNPRHPQSRFSHSVDDPCRNREGQNGRTKQRRQRWQRCEGMHRSQETSHGSHSIATNASSRTNGIGQWSCPDPEVLANRQTRRRQWRRLRSRLLRQPRFRWGTQSQRTKVLCLKKEEDEEGYKKDKPPNFQRWTWRETRISPSQSTGLVWCNWNCDRQGHAQEFQAHTGWQCQGMVHRSLGQGEAHSNMALAYQLLLSVLFYPGAIPHPSS